MLDFILLSSFSYLLGSFCFAHIIGKIKKIDFSKIGSKSYTSTNVSRALGLRWGAVSAVFDFLKGFFPTWLAVYYLEINWQIVIVAILPTIGHIFPLFFGFKGGKGGAAFLGASLGLIGLKYFLAPFLIWLLLLALTKITSFTNLIFPWFLSLFLYFYLPQYLTFGIVETILITFALRDNVKRLILGKEPKTPFKL